MDAERDRAGEADGGQRPQDGVGDPGPQRPPVQLVERVGGDAHRQQEGEQRLDQPSRPERAGAIAAPITTYDRCQSV